MRDSAGIAPDFAALNVTPERPARQRAYLMVMTPGTQASASAFAPGRVNLIGAHTDDHGGLALPFAAPTGVTVTAVYGTAVTGGASPLVQATLAELRSGGLELPAVSVAIASELPAGIGLASSAAVGVATVLALLGLAGGAAWPAMQIAVLCQRVRHRLGVETGVLDELAILLGRSGQATLIDFGTLSWSHVPVKLGGARLALLDSGERRQLVVQPNAKRRLRHVRSENERVRLFVENMGDPVALGALLDESHMSLRDDFEISTPLVEETVRRALVAGAFGARITDGGASVLALFPGDARLPGDAVEVAPAAGARLL